MESIKYRSIIKKIILFPMLVILSVTVIMIASIIVSYITMENQLIEKNVNTLQVSLKQLENQLNQLDNEFIQFVSSSKSYKFLSLMDEDTSTNQYILYQADVIERLTNQTLFYKNVGGVFSYFSKMKLLIFRGNAADKWINHQYFIERLQKGDMEYNHWQVADIKGKKYLVIIKKYFDYYWGCWIELDQLMKEYGLNNKQLGVIYIADENNHNTLIDDELNRSVLSMGYQASKINSRKMTYRNYHVSIYDGDITFGLLIPRLSILYKFPFYNKLLLAMAVLPFILIPVISIWLKKEIVLPLKSMDIAMKEIRQGEMEYRIEIPKKVYYNEIDRLMFRFNEMMNDINELEFNLYKTKISQQRTELKYISQQIRPHFILNALNIIYTYEVDEFYLIKKMVLYLSDYFRYVVNLKYDFVSITAELGHANNYFMIQRERYPDRFEYNIILDDEVKSCVIPPLLLQTFLENCIKYAMKNNEKLSIQISAQRTGDRLKLTIRDNGNGFHEEVLVQINRFITDREYQQHLGVGIQNAIERLDILYQNNYEIKIQNASDGGALIEILLPFEPMN